MKIIEFQSTVDRKGRLIIPPQLLREMELAAGDRVKLTCAVGCAGSKCGALDLREHEPEYSGYSFLPDGKYSAGVGLCSMQEVKDYIEMQKDYQHRVMICDSDDCCVFEMKRGVVIHPSLETIEAHQKEQEQGGMKMDM
jgi:hypothetical protein